MKILIIISQYAPAQTPNTLRWEAIIKAFHKSGHQVEVLTTRRNGFESGQRMDGVTTHRTGFNSLKDRLYDWLSTESRRNESRQKEYKPSVFKNTLERLIDIVWRKYYWPDGAKLFLRPGITLGNNLISNHGFTHVISVGLPFSCHLIAQSIKSNNPKIHWLMDIQDPFSYSQEFWVNNFKKYTRKNIDAEQQAFLKADNIVVNNSVAMKKYISLFTESQSKLALIPPLLNPPSELFVKQLQPEGKIHLIYMGSFYEKVRSPQNFLKFLITLKASNPEFLETLHIHIVGQADRISHHAFQQFPMLKKYFSFYGFLKHSDAVNFLHSADILLNFGNTTNYHLPSKTVEYLYFNKPVINIISREDDSSRLFWKGQLEVLNLNLSHPGSLHISEFKKFILKPRNAASLNVEVLKTYGAETISKAYLKLLSRRNSGQFNI